MRTSSRIALCVIALGLLAVYVASTGANDATRADELIRTLGTPPSVTVSIAGSEYTVENGAVSTTHGAVDAHDRLRALELAYAIKYARSAPLFSLQGTDPDSFARSVDTLQESLETLAQIMEHSSPATARTARESLPRTFLLSMAQTERARLAFVDHPSETTYASYTEALEGTAQALLSGLAQYQSLLKEVFTRKNATLDFFTRTLTYRDITDTAEALTAAAREARSALTARERCLAGAVENCAQARLEDLTQTPAQATTPPPAVTHNAALLHSIEDAFAAYDLTRPQPILSISSPIPCLSPYEGPTYVLPYFSKIHGEEQGIAFHRLNEVFFWDIALATSEKNVGRNYFESMRKRGITYAYQPITTLYFCPDNALLFGIGVSMIHSNMELLAMRPELHTLLQNPSTASLSKELDSRIDAPVLSEDSLSELLDTLKKTLCENADTKNQDLCVRITSLYAEFQARSAHADLQMLTVARQNNFYAKLYQNGESGTLSPEYLLTAKTSLPFGFLSYNRSIFPTYIPLTKPRDESNTPDYLLTRAQVQERISVTQMRDMMRLSSRFELALP